MEIQNNEYPELLNRFLNYLDTKGKSKNTIKNYGLHLEQFLRYMTMKKIKKSKRYEEITDIKDFPENIYKKITVKTIDQYQAFLKNNDLTGKNRNENNKGNSNSSINNKISAIQTYFDFLVKESVLKYNVVKSVERIKEEKKVIGYLTIEEANKLLDHIKTKDTVVDKRNYMIVNLFLNTGMRLDELFKLNIRNINFSNKSLVVSGKGNKEREIPLNDRCLESIKEYLKIRANFIKDNVDEEALFISERYRRLSKSSIQKQITQYGKETGLDVHVHKLRHTAGTIMIQNGVKLEIIQEILGHSDISTTLIYAKVNDKQRRTGVNVLGDLLG